MPGTESNQLFLELLRELAVVGRDIDNATECFTFAELSTGNQRNNQQDLRNCALLNRANPYFNLPPKKMNRTGNATMMSSRNNNFSNRGQKFKLNVFRKYRRPPSANSGGQPPDGSGSGGGGNGGGSSGTPVVGIVVSILVVTGLIGVLLVKREKISKYVSDTKRTIQLSTALYLRILNKSLLNWGWKDKRCVIYASMGEYFIHT